MTLARAQDLQAAVYSRLATALATAGVGGVAVPIFDHIAQDPPRLHVRLDGFSVDPMELRGATRIATHSFTAHVFDRPGEAGPRGQSESKRLLGLIEAALQDWRPLSGGGPLTLFGAFVEPDPDGVTIHAAATFTVTL
ncbi:MAG: hypothetical protein AAGM38_18680 [Pseudomonadota bacterium]